MNSSDQDRLWRDVFSDEKLEAMREATLRAGVAAARGRRRNRLILSAAAGMVAAGLALAVSWRRPQPPARLVPVAVARPAESSVKFISDQQLLALFPNRPVALIGPAGSRQLVFLDAIH